MKVFSVSLLCLLALGSAIAQPRTSGTFSPGFPHSPRDTFPIKKLKEDYIIALKSNVDSIFQHLELDSVPDGLLLDYALQLIPVDAYNGVLTDSTYINQQVLQQIYYTLLMGRVEDTERTAKGFVLPEEFQSRWGKNQSRQSIALAGLYFTYSRFFPDAYPSKIAISADSSQVMDKYVNGEWKNPYQPMKTFAIAPLMLSYKYQNKREQLLSVKIPRTLFYTNHPEQIASLEIDFDDGNGYRRVNYDQLITVKGGVGVKTWTYKLTLRNGIEVLYARSKILLVE